MEDVAQQLFPCEDTNRVNVFLFMAFKICPAGKFKALLSSISKGIVLIRDSNRRSSSVNNSHLMKYLKYGPEKSIKLSDGTTIPKPLSKSDIFDCLLKNQQTRFEIAGGLASAIISDCSSVQAEQDCALSLIFYHNMSKVFPFIIMQSELGYNWLGKRQVEVDVEHALAAKCTLGESGRVFTKCKRAMRVATKNALKFPSDTDVLKLESEKDIGDKPEIMENGGRFNTVHSVNTCYLLSQPYMSKEGDIFCVDPDDGGVEIVALFENDGAGMANDRSAILAGEKFVKSCYGENIQSQKYFEDPTQIIDLALVDGKEELTVIHDMV